MSTLPSNGNHDLVQLLIEARAALDSIANFHGAQRWDLSKRIDAALANAHETRAVSPDEGFQARVYDWMAKCFMRPDSMLPVQRSFRFVEEALELAQASGTSREEALRLVEYVYGRPAGRIGQEIGGVMVTLSGLATSFGLSMEYAGNAELARCKENTEKIRAKDLAKPQRSPLPGPISEKANSCACTPGEASKHAIGCPLNGMSEPE